MESTGTDRNTKTGVNGCENASRFRYYVSRKMVRKGVKWTRQYGSQNPPQDGQKRWKPSKGLQLWDRWESSFEATKFETRLSHPQAPCLFHNALQHTWICLLSKQKQNEAKVQSSNWRLPVLNLAHFSSLSPHHRTRHVLCHKLHTYMWAQDWETPHSGWALRGEK